MHDSLDRNRELGLVERIRSLSPLLIILLCLIAGIGFAALYSAGGGSFDPWASRQMVRFALGLVVFFAVALTDLRLWLRVVWPFYIVTLLLLVGVDIAGHIGMGAQRWLSLGPLKIQPSELAKISVVLALAAWFHALPPEEPVKIRQLFVPILVVLVPVALVLKQPDLGTALMILLMSAGMFWLAGVRLWVFGAGLAGLAGVLPMAWNFLHDYQKKRLLTFLNPEADPTGAGYHILQSKIALGSGGFSGKGFLMGSQSHLNFLPEKQTDFIFTLLAEEWGLTGGLVVLSLFALVIAWGTLAGLHIRSTFGRLLTLGLTLNVFLYVFINTGMVMGLLPVVGVPLPLVSYGGTATLTVMAGFGLMMCAVIHREARLARRG